MSGLLAHAVSGTGPTVVLLNGGLMSQASWDPVALPLEREMRVVRCDLRGQLLTPGPPPTDLAGHLDDVAALLDHVSPRRPVHLAGTSFGALVALALAAGHPRRVLSVCAIAATDHVEEGDWQESRPVREAALAAAGGGDGARVFDLLAEPTFSPAFRAAHAQALAARRAAVGQLPRRFFADLGGLFEALHGLDLRPLLPRVACPVLVLAGELDATFPLERSRALAAQLPRATLEILEGAGHGVVVERPDLVLARLRAFILAHAPSAGPSSGGS